MGGVSYVSENGEYPRRGPRPKRMVIVAPGTVYHVCPCCLMPWGRDVVMRMEPGSYLPATACCGFQAYAPAFLFPSRLGVDPEAAWR